MRSIDAALKARVLKIQQTLYNNAQPSMDIQALRPRTTIFHEKFWRETIVSNDVTATSTSIAIRKNGKLADRVYVAYVSDGELIVKSAALTYPLANMAWQLETSITGCSCCSLAFDGQFTAVPNGRVEFRTDLIPWLFFTTSSGQLRAGILGGPYDSLIDSGVSAISAVRGFSSPLKDIDQGMLLFHIIDGSVYVIRFRSEERRVGK